MGRVQQDRQRSKLSRASTAEGGGGAAGELPPLELVVQRRCMLPSVPRTQPQHPPPATQGTGVPTCVKQHAVLWLQQVAEGVKVPAVRVQLALVLALGGKHDLQRRVVVQASVLLEAAAGRGRPGRRAGKSVGAGQAGGADARWNATALPPSRLGWRCAHAMLPVPASPRPNGQLTHAPRGVLEEVQRGGRAQHRLLQHHRREEAVHGGGRQHALVGVADAILQVCRRGAQHVWSGLAPTLNTPGPAQALPIRADTQAQAPGQGRAAPRTCTMHTATSVQSTPFRPSLATNWSYITSRFCRATSRRVGGRRSQQAGGRAGKRSVPMLRCTRRHSGRPPKTPSPAAPRTSQMPTSVLRSSS